MFPSSNKRYVVPSHSAGAQSTFNWLSEGPQKISGRAVGHPREHSPESTSHPHLLGPAEVADYVVRRYRVPNAPNLQDLKISQRNSHEGCVESFHSLRVFSHCLNAVDLQLNRALLEDIQASRHLWGLDMPHLTTMSIHSLDETFNILPGRTFSSMRSYSLRHLTLVGVHLDCASPLLNNLTRLKIECEHSPKPMIPTWRQLVDTLGRMSELEELYLKIMLPEDTTSAEELGKYVPLQRLHALTMHCSTSAQLRTFLSLVRTPSLDYMDAQYVNADGLKPNYIPTLSFLMNHSSKWRDDTRSMRIGLPVWWHEYERERHQNYVFECRPDDVPLSLPFDLETTQSRGIRITLASPPKPKPKPGSNRKQYEKATAQAAALATERITSDFLTVYSLRNVRHIEMTYVSDVTSAFFPLFSGLKHLESLSLSGQGCLAIMEALVAPDAFPALSTLTLSWFSVEYGLEVSKEDVEKHFNVSFAQRVYRGAPIKHLKIVRCCRTFATMLEGFKNFVLNVEWDGRYVDADQVFPFDQTLSTMPSDVFHKEKKS